MWSQWGVLSFCWCLWLLWSTHLLTLVSGVRGQSGAWCHICLLSHTPTDAHTHTRAHSKIDVLIFSNPPSFASLPLSLTPTDKQHRSAFSRPVKAVKKINKSMPTHTPTYTHTHTEQYFSLSSCRSSGRQASDFLPDALWVSAIPSSIARWLQISEKHPGSCWVC